ASFVGFGGEGGGDLGDEVGGVEAGGLAECLGDGAVDAADPDLGVWQVDEGVAGGVEAVGGGAQRRGLAGADFPGDDAEAAGADEPAQAGDGFLGGGGGEQGGDGDVLGERHAGEAVVGLQVGDHGCSFPAGPSAVGGCDGGGDEGDVAAVEAAEALAEADGDPGLGEAGGDEQDGPLGGGAGQAAALQGGDGGVPADDGERLTVGDGGAGGDDLPERGVVQEPAVSDEQVRGRGVGEHPGGGGPEQGGKRPGGECLGVHRSASRSPGRSSRADRRSRAASAASSASATSPR